ncbi:alpha/beta hydrolase fold domain-containing protein [Rhodococcus coprophilus]|uniref:Esterase n=1 Tax=Rhodococcus coprophilus TaxID=38310 RepID=A0A2X4X296_9NOCA|nr:alpha/beta hydrolase fold domain-containing protein [Rhodococcus coprophilus]MBM7458783.1 acetyl esterase/lipase [Rhodococcus coprophilus]SQI33475.1 esterase [Rhodococcus coprophilus]
MARGLRWITDHADELGADPDRIVVAGTSAGGGAPPVSLMVRDLGGLVNHRTAPVLPLLDHRNTSTSSRPYSGRPSVRTRETHEFAWNAVLAAPDIPGFSSSIGFGVR